MPSSAWHLVVAAMAVTLAGCARTVLESSVVDGLAGEARELDFWQGLEDQPVITVNDALHGLLLLTDGSDPSSDYAERLEEARRRGWVSAGKDLAANESAAVGMVAVAACQIVDIKGGVTMHLLGPSPRWCTRELVFLEILPPRTEHQALSGLEFLDLVGRLEDRLAAGG